MTLKWQEDGDFSSSIQTEEKSPKRDDAASEAPPDRFNVAFILMILLGMGSLYPWTFFTTAADYFRYTFRNTTDSSKVTTYENIFENALTIISTGCGVLGMLLNSFLTRHVSFKHRIYVGFVIIVAMFILTTILTLIDTDSWQGGFFVVTMISVFVINLASNAVGGGLFGIQGCLPSKFATALMVGQTFAGIFAVIANVASIVASVDETDKTTGIKKQGAGYFGSAIAATSLCLIGFAGFLRLPIIKHYLQPLMTIQKPLKGVEKIVESKGHSSLRAMFLKTWQHGAILLLNFAVTLSIFPAIASSVRSLQSGNPSLLTKDLFVPMACFLIFNCGDLAGRLAHGFLQYPNPKQGAYTFFIAVLRVGLLPLLFYCNAQPRTHTTAVFGDGGFIVLMTVLAFSNGYLGSLGVMYTPKLVPPEHAEMTGALVGVAINSGLFIGSAFSFALLYLL